MLLLEIHSTRVAIRNRFILLAKSEKEKGEKKTLVLIAVVQEFNVKNSLM